MQAVLTIDQAKQLVRTKEHLYKAMQRNRWYLPKLRTSLVTQEYLQDVRSNILWCPKYEEIRLQPCPDPPSKDYLVSEVLKRTNAKHLQTGITDKHVPDKAWLLTVLSTLQYDHEIFKKDYLPPIKPPPKEDIVINNEDNFYTDLPILFKHKDLKRKSKLKEYQLGSKESSIKKLKEKKARLEMMIVEKAEALKALEKKEEHIKIPKSEYDMFVKSKRREEEKSKTQNVTTRKQNKTPNKDRENTNLFSNQT